MNQQENKKNTSQTSRNQSDLIAERGSQLQKVSHSNCGEQKSELMKRIGQAKSLNKSISAAEPFQGLYSKNRWILNTSQNRETLIDYLICVMIYPIFFGGSRCQNYYPCCNCFVYRQTHKSGYSSPIDVKTMLVREKDLKEVKSYRKALIKQTRKNDKKKPWKLIWKDNKEKIIRYLKSLGMKKLEEFLEEKIPHKSGYFQFPCVRVELKYNPTPEKLSITTQELKLNGRKDFEVVRPKYNKSLLYPEKKTTKETTNSKSLEDFFNQQEVTEIDFCPPQTSPNSIEKLLLALNDDMSSMNTTPTKSNNQLDDEYSNTITPFMLNSAPPLKRSHQTKSATRTVSSAESENQMNQLIKQMKKMSVKRQSQPSDLIEVATSPQEENFWHEQPEETGEEVGVESSSSQRSKRLERPLFSFKKPQSSFQQSQVEFLRKLKDQKKRQVATLLREIEDLDFQIEHLLSNQIH